jgi:hypothetical protein
MQKKLTFDEVRDIVNQVTFQDRLFKVIKKHEDMFLIQMQYIEADVKTGKMVKQNTRKWHVSPWMTESEIVQTCLKCVLTSQEHIGREYFKYKGYKLFGPHMDVNDMIRVIQDGELREAHRDPPSPTVSDPGTNPFAWSNIRHDYQPHQHSNYCRVCEQSEENPVHETEER